MYYKNNYSFIYCNEEQIRSYVDKMIDSKKQLKIYNENEINLIKSRWNRTISIFNENLSLANYSVILLRKNLVEEEPEIFLTKEC